MSDGPAEPADMGEQASADTYVMSNVEYELVRAVIDLSRSCMSMAEMLTEIGAAVPEVVTPEWTVTYRNALSAAIEAFDRVDRFTGRHKTP